MVNNQNRKKTLIRGLLHPWTTLRDQILILTNHVRRVPKPVRQAFIIVTIVHVFGEIPSMLKDAWPKYWTVYIDPYFSPWFHFKVERCWYFKDITEEVEQIGTYYAFCKIALQYSVVAFLGIFIYFCYHVIDGLFYLWNFKQSHVIYWDLLWYVIVLQRIAISPSKADNWAKVKSLF